MGGSSYVQQFETAFVKREMEKANLKRQTSVEKAKLDIVTLKRRDEDLDVLFKRICENVAAGRLSPERFDKLSSAVLRTTSAKPGTAGGSGARNGKRPEKAGL